MEKLPKRCGDSFNMGQFEVAPLKFNSSFTPEKWWLEDDPFLLGRSLFRGELLNFEGGKPLGVWNPLAVKCFCKNPPVSNQ